MRTRGVRPHLRGDWPRQRMGTKSSTALDDIQAASHPPPLTPFKVSQGGGDVVPENLDKIYGFKLEETDQLEWSRLSFPPWSTNEDLRKVNGENYGHTTSVLMNLGPNTLVILRL